MRAISLNESSCKTLALTTYNSRWHAQECVAPRGLGFWRFRVLFAAEMPRGLGLREV